LARYPLQEVIEILRILRPVLSQQGRTLASRINGSYVSSYSSPRSSISTWSTNRSRGAASSLLGRSSSAIDMSDVSSIHDSVYSNTTLATDISTVPNRLALAPSSRRGGASVSAMQAQKGVTSPASPTVNSAEKSGFQCPFCFEVDVFSSTKRKSDLRKHFKAFHMTNVQWICFERGDCKEFDCKPAFESHVKDAHNSRGPAKHAIADLCPQVVFACGYSDCRFVLEASGEADSDESALEYFNHVANHFDDNLTHRNWSYSVRFRNLMRQNSVDKHWKERHKGARPLCWQPFTSPTGKPDASNGYRDACTMAPNYALS
ncbi:hypothetical protein B0T22DRAFT_510173, partial [Podospora appendiculata]